MKVRSEKTASKIEKELNSKSELTHLNSCPRCGEDYDEIGAYVFEGSGVSFTQKCNACGIYVHHNFDWVSSEVELEKV